MKVIKKVMALVLAAMMIAAMSVGAWADSTVTAPAATDKNEGSFSITLTNA